MGIEVGDATRIAIFELPAVLANEYTDHICGPWYMSSYTVARKSNKARIAIITYLITQQARAMPIYGQKAIVICNRYPAIYVDRQDSSEILQSAAQPQLFSLQKAFR